MAAKTGNAHVFGIIMTDRIEIPINVNLLAQ